MKCHLKFIKFVLFYIVLFGIYGCTQKKLVTNDMPRRIISLSPSITETLFTLGLGERLVGVTTYCKYPPQAVGISKIGGYSDANLEKIISLHPDLVVLSSEHEKQRIYLERFKIRTLTINNSTFTDVCSSFAAIGNSCSVTHLSDSLIRLFGESLSRDTSSMQRLPKVLLCIGRESPGLGMIKNIFAAGRTTFYNEIIEAAGGQNAFSDTIAVEYPRLSPEGIIALAPDVIIDIVSDMDNCDCSLLVKDWQAITRIPAVKKNQVFCISADYATVPGPRILLLIEDVRKLLKSATEGSF